MNKPYVIIGGGIAGLLSALILKKKYPQNEVVLIERAAQLGGLLNSIPGPGGMQFDYGTHIPKPTGNAEIDSLFFDLDFKNGEWLQLSKLLTGNYFNHRLNTKSQLISFEQMPADVFARGLQELMQTKPVIEDDALSCKNYLHQFYGKIFAEQVYVPIVERFYKISSDQLFAHAHRILDNQRLIVGDESFTRNLKKTPFFDDKVGWPSHAVSPSLEVPHFYPRKPGIGKWIEHLQAKLLNQGVQIFTGTHLTDFKHSNHEITEVTFSNGKTYSPKQVIWSAGAPVPFYKKIAPENSPVKLAPPEFVKFGLAHFIFEKPFLVDNHYLYCFQPEMLSHRITLYPNFSEPVNGHACTVEVLMPEEKIESLETVILAELKTMGIVDPDLSPVFSQFQKLEAGFPKLTHASCNGMKTMTEAVTVSFNNIVCAGKGASMSFYMNEVLETTYQQISSL